MNQELTVVEGGATPVNPVDAEWREVPPAAPEPLEFELDNVKFQVVIAVRQGGRKVGEQTFNSGPAFQPLSPTLLQDVINGCLERAPAQFGPKG